MSEFAARKGTPVDLVAQGDLPGGMIGKFIGDCDAALRSGKERPARKDTLNVISERTALWPGEELAKTQ